MRGTLLAICLIVAGGHLFAAGNVTVTTQSGNTVRLQAMDRQIIRVTTSCNGEFSDRESLSVTAQPQESGCKIKMSRNSVSLSTGSVTASVDRKTGEVSFYDRHGREILKESASSFTPKEVDGDKGYSVRQTFLSPNDEAFYGLGQHQSNEMNYKGRNETLYQYNTKISVPFIVSTRNYGILWDNCSLSRWGDSRDYADMNELFDMGEGLKATYTDSRGQSVTRYESVLDYSDLDKVKNFPEEFIPRFYNSQIVWEGDIEPRQSGKHRFILYYAGYTKLFVDGREVVPEHWRTAWNPNSVKFDIEMREGEKHRLRIEWKPDGGVSYLSLKGLSPVSRQEEQQMSWWSEMADEIDYYFIAGENADGVISGYRRLTGKAPIMPKWAMGYWQSRERYKNQNELTETVDEYRRRGIGLDNIVLDWSYWREDDWGSHEFDSKNFPDPKAMIDKVHDANAHIMISVWPKFYITTDHFKEFDDMGAMYRLAVQDSIRDWIGKGYIGSFYDAYNPEARELFWKQMNEHLFSYGIDAWWMDASEPDILSNASLEYRKALSTPNFLGNSTRYLNTYALVNAQAIYEGQRKQSPDQRVFLLTRSGFAGLQRYSTASWSGDTGTCWEDMRAQITAGINFSMSGIPYWTQDIGGFSVQNRYQRMRDGSADMDEWREMNTRWHQWGAFCPLYRSHGQFPYREIYNIAPEGTQAYESMVYYNRLRYKLMPYIYSLAWRTWHDDYTIMRSLAMDFGNDTKVRNLTDQFMFGDAFMVCPVTTYHARSRTVYLPEGCGWYDFYDNSLLLGGRETEAEAPYERMPLFVREGVIVITGPDVAYAMQPTDGRLSINIYTGKDGETVLYEDDGVSYDYENGASTLTRFTWKQSDGRLKISEREGWYDGAIKERTMLLRFISPDGVTEKTITYTGKAQSVKP